jgi:hypothetical protein
MLFACVVKTVIGKSVWKHTTSGPREFWVKCHLYFQKQKYIIEQIGEAK